MKKLERLLHLGLEEARLKAKTDLFWLATKVLGYDLVPEVHAPVCDLFVHKQPDRGLYDQDTVKQRLLLDPRGHFKTTIDICDIIQWILCFPDARILIMSGTRELATRMLAECKSHFQYNEKLRALFPEYCPQDHIADFGTSEAFTTPARTNWKLREPTVSISTVDSIKAGSHYDIIKCDDLVNETNCNTRETLEATTRAFHYTTPLLDPGGYRDVIGTRYAYDDLYGHILDGDRKGWAISVRSAWQVQTQADGSVRYEVLFPERFALELLQTYQSEDPYLFNCQYLNNPIPGESQHFTPQLMTDHFLPWTQVPKELRVYVTWDLGFSQKQHADWSVGAVGGYDSQGRLYILDLVRGRFMPHELVNAIIGAVLRYKPQRVGIEAAGGSVLLGPALEHRARELRLPLPIEWLKVRNTKDSKRHRISGLEALLRANQLYFSNAMSHKDALLEEFTRFPKYRHDDIPDSIAMLEEFRTRLDIEWPDDRVEVPAFYGGNPELGGLTG